VSVNNSPTEAENKKHTASEAATVDGEPPGASRLPNLAAPKTNSVHCQPVSLSSPPPYHSAGVLMYDESGFSAPLYPLMHSDTALPPGFPFDTNAASFPRSDFAAHGGFYPAAHETPDYGVLPEALHAFPRNQQGMFSASAHPVVPPFAFDYVLTAAQGGYVNSDQSCYGYGTGDGTCEGESAEGEAGVLGWSSSSPPVLHSHHPPAPPSAAVAASHLQEAAWKRQCLSVTCVPLARDVRPSTDTDSKGDNDADFPFPEAKRQRTCQEPRENALQECSRYDEAPWDAVVWRWLTALGMTNDIEEVLNPGAQRVLVRWSSDQAARRWEAVMEATALKVPRQTVFENTLLKWS
jgi:hypothetical protein